MINPMDAPAIRWGILAPGGIARRFAKEVPAYTQSQIVAVGSRSLGRAQRFIQDNLDGQAKAYGSYEELVADGDVDAIYVASPHSEHRDHALMALHAGKPVLVEKAFALNAAQAEEVFAEAERLHLFVMEAMWSRFLPHYTAMRDIIASGDLGEVRCIDAVHAQYLDMDPNWRMMNPRLGGGALLDLGIYPVSLIHWLWGVPDQISATGVLTPTGVDLRENITLRYTDPSGDRLGVAYADMGAAGANCLQIVGTEARITIPDWFYTPQDLLITPLDGESRTIPTNVKGGFQYEAAEAARCIAAGFSESLLMPWSATREVLAITDEIRRQLGVTYPQETA